MGLVLRGRRGAIVPRPQSMPLDELLAGRSRSRNNIKRRLLEAGLKESSCEQCGISKWEEKPLTLALHHVNGDGTDNSIENLVLLCPNCHSQTPNFGAKNWKQRNADGERTPNGPPKLRLV
jgi:HNH endonuclease